MERQALNIRLAMRVEGDFWSAYFAKADTMEGATLLGSIRMSLVTGPEHRDRKDAFMAMMQDAMNDKVMSVGLDPLHWNAPHAAPEHEKAGSA